MDISLSSQEEAKDKLITKMSKMDSSGEIRELLFKDDDLEISEINITDINTEIKRYFKNHPEKLYELSPRKFEELIADIFNDLGFDVQLTQATRDGGRDIIARIKNAVTDYLTYVECKRYAAENKIGVGIIREVSGVHYIKNPSKSIIVTTSFFTSDAKEKATKLKNQLALKDYNNIKEWLSKY
ncbi:MAG: restriction endonuclease [Balneolaceae bacterium]|nr:restriction endonuclease [Balneolaceae bacterium]